MTLHTLYHIHEPQDKGALKKGYIGITDNAPRRKKEHFAKLKEGMHENQHLQLAFHKVNGNLKFTVIEQSIDRKRISGLEEHYRPNKGYGWNVKKGGEGGMIHTPTQNQISKRTFNQASTNKGFSKLLKAEQSVDNQRIEKDMIYYNDGVTAPFDLKKGSGTGSIALKHKTKYKPATKPNTSMSFSKVRPNKDY